MQSIVWPLGRDVRVDNIEHADVLKEKLGVLVYGTL